MNHIYTDNKNKDITTINTLVLEKSAPNFIDRINKFHNYLKH